MTFRWMQRVVPYGGRLLALLAGLLLSACAALDPIPGPVQAVSYQRLACEPAPRLAGAGYCAVGIVTMNYTGYRLILVSPAAPWFTNAAVRAEPVDRGGLSPGDQALR
jgi:hypothetical protein